MSGTRWVKPAKGSYAPRCFVAVVVEGRPIPGTVTAAGEDVRWDHAAMAVTRYRYGRWSDPVVFEPRDGEHLIESVEAQAQSGKGTWVVAPIASYALTLSGFFTRWDRLGVQWRRRGGLAAGAATTPTPTEHSAGETPHGDDLRRFNSAPASPGYIVSTCITRGNPDIVRYSIGDRTLTWVSGHQYWAASEDGIAAMLRPAGKGGAGSSAESPATTRSAAERAVLWAHAMSRLADWWRRVDGGPWSATMGGLAMSYFRHRLKPKSVLAHQEPDAREVEERALFGGQASTWCYADIGVRPTRAEDGSRQPPAGDYPRIDGDLEHWDIASMYPTILATEPFPDRLLFIRDHPSMDRLKDELRDRGVIADVTLSTDRPDYPYRDEDRVIWPVGQYRTCLVGPELRRAVDAGHVLHVHRSVSYRMGRPFAEAAGSLLKLRREAYKVGDKAWETLVKNLSNSFAGKLAQKRFDWVAQPNKAPMQAWGEWVQLDAKTERRHVYRAAAGLVWERSPPKHNGRPLASCFCFLTAYGRELMRQLRALIPADRVASMDTDGLWIIRPTAYLWSKVRRAAAARGYILRRTAGATAARFYGARHYWTSKGWVLAGYHEPRRIGRGLTFEDVQTHIPQASLERGPPTTVHLHRRVTQLAPIQADGRIGDDGWARPIRITEGRPPELPPLPAAEPDSLHERLSSPSTTPESV